MSNKCNVRNCRHIGRDQCQEGEADEIVEPQYEVDLWFQLPLLRVVVQQDDSDEQHRAEGHDNR